MDPFQMIDNECCVCYESDVTFIETECKHLLCEDCSVKHFKKSGKCPMCRFQLRPEPLFSYDNSVPNADSLIEYYERVYEMGTRGIIIDVSGIGGGWPLVRHNFSMFANNSHMDVLHYVSTIERERGLRLNVDSMFMSGQVDHFYLRFRSEITEMIFADVMSGLINSVSVEDISEYGDRISNCQICLAMCLFNVASLYREQVKEKLLSELKKNKDRSTVEILGVENLRKVEKSFKRLHDIVKKLEQKEKIDLLYETRYKENKKIREQKKASKRLEIIKFNEEKYTECNECNEEEKAMSNDLGVKFVDEGFQGLTWKREKRVKSELNERRYINYSLQV